MELLAKECHQNQMHLKAAFSQIAKLPGLIVMLLVQLSVL